MQLIPENIQENCNFSKFAFFLEKYLFVLVLSILPSWNKNFELLEIEIYYRLVLIQMFKSKQTVNQFDLSD